MQLKMRRLSLGSGRRYLHVTVLNPPDPKPIFERGSFAGANRRSQSQRGDGYFLKIPPLL